MNFQQLRFVIAVADTGSFTKAADLCCVTQPALSNAINQFEEELGSSLFERTTRSVTTTEFGDHVIEDMRKILTARGRLFSRAGEFLARDDRTVRIGLSPLISSEFVESFLKKIKTLDSKMDIVLSEMNKADIIPALESGTIDFGLGPVPLTDSDDQSISIYSEPLLLLTSKINKEGELPAKLDELTEKQFLLVQDVCGLSGAVRMLFRDHKLDLEEYQGRALSYHILEKWAQLGIGITLLPASKVTDFSYARRLDDVHGKPVTISFQASWNKAQEDRSSFKAIFQSLSNTAS
ncbi:MAG: LysR family transcriptional regulator [Halopseudomonas aestusnigri]